MRDHEPITVSNFRGLFDRGEDEVVPMGYFISCQNNRYTKGGVYTREGSSLTHTLASVKRMAIYKRTGEAQRILILNGSGELYDSAVSFVVPILTIVAMTDFSVVTMFNRAYITPHNGQRGIAGEKVYVYQGSGVARAAAGNAPSAFTLTAVDSAASGNVEVGQRVFAVCFETDSGFVTTPGGAVALVSLGDKKVDISLIPVGPSGTVARVLVATKAITDFNGDFNAQTYYFVPNGRIGDNTTTTAQVDFFDSELLNDATYLLEQLAEIPAGVGIALYRGRLVVWGEDANDSIFRASGAGLPESHNSVEGYGTVNPGDSGGGIKNTAEYRNQLIILKSQRTYVTQDNGEEAAFWTIAQLDASIGTECHGIGRILDFGQILEDKIVVADRGGLRVFDGTYGQAPLTFSIDDVWDRINKSAFDRIEVAIDANACLIYVALPLDSATLPDVLYVGDYSEGMTSETIKWDKWVFPVAPTTIIVDVITATKRAILRIGSTAGNVYSLDGTATNDFANAIDSFIRFGLLPDSKNDDVNHFTGIRVRVKGAGTLQIFVRSLDAALTLNAQGLTLSTAPGFPMTRLFNFVSERASVRLRVNQTDESYNITKFILYVTKLWEERVSG